MADVPGARGARAGRSGRARRPRARSRCALGACLRAGRAGEDGGSRGRAHARPRDRVRRGRRGRLSRRGRTRDSISCARATRPGPSRSSATQSHGDSAIRSSCTIPPSRRCATVRISRPSPRPSRRAPGPARRPPAQAFPARYRLAARSHVRAAAPFCVIQVEADDAGAQSEAPAGSVTQQRKFRPWPSISETFPTPCSPT